MKVADLLSRLESVRQSGRGWRGRCPAHDDRNPSLSIHAGEHGVLIRCWAGCELTSIVAALGLAVRDLFYDAALPPPEHRRARRQLKPKRYDFRKAADEFLFYAIDLRLRAERVLVAANGLDPSGWSDEQLERAMRAVSKAYHDLERADVLDGIGFSIRARGLAKEKEHARQRAA